MINIQYMVRFVFVIVVVFCSSCDSLLEVEPPVSKVPYGLIFSDDAMAESAVIGMYIDLYSSVSFAGGAEQSVASVAGLSADELVNNPQQDPKYLGFERNALTQGNAALLSLWSSMYKGVYEANSILEGLEASTGLTTDIRDQLRGEAFFVRSFCYFYLVNLFGDVPLVLSTDYKANARLSRRPVVDVYGQIISDLTTAEDLLTDAYDGQDRIRPNKSAANAFLARLYLYVGDWARAEEKATKVLAKGQMYVLHGDLNSVFLSSSKEAIWQLRPYDDASYTNEGYTFGIDVAPGLNVLHSETINSFEDGDRRREAWVKSVVANGKMLYLPYKYKRYRPGPLTDEFSMVLRLAEVYLIRAEARAQQEKLTAAILDLDEIRKRAGLTLVNDLNPGISQADLLTAIDQERRIEFMAEWGHRWLDLKRRSRAIEVLSSIKSDFNGNDLLYPIPENEIRNNKNLEPQNLGY